MIEGKDRSADTMGFKDPFYVTGQEVIPEET